MQILQHIDELIVSIGREGGVMSLFALFGLLTFVLIYLSLRLVHSMLKEQSKRADKREKQTRDDNVANLERERQNAENYREMTDRVVTVVETNTHVMTSVDESVGFMQRMIQPTLERIENYLSKASQEGDN